jgi:peptide deformylase
MTKIVQKEDKVLREISKDVPVEDITSPKIQKILKDMSEALIEEDDGVAIAAPQIGLALNIFVVSGKIFHEDFIRFEGLRRESKDIPKDMVFINPKLLKVSKKKEWMPEGCLSVRWLYGEVERSKKATVEAYDENGKKFKRGASGLLAQIFQHETDHLKGVLFTDKAKDIQDLPPEK